MKTGPAPDDQDKDEALNPHRREEQAHAALETAGRLHRRGIEVDSGEDPELLADLLSAVERFEARVETLGGDLMVNDLKSSQPDDRRFVLPRRVPREPLTAYLSRIDAATSDLGRARTTARRGGSGGRSEGRETSRKR